MSVAAFIPAAPEAESDPAVSGTPSVADLWIALRLDPPADATSDTGRRLAWALAMAVERADRQAPAAPAAARREAIFMACGWLYEGFAYSANWWQRSGAASCLKPWTVRRAGAVG